MYYEIVLVGLAKPPNPTQQGTPFLQSLEIFLNISFLLMFKVFLSHFFFFRSLAS
jgi:hypothetical protein